MSRIFSLIMIIITGISFSITLSAKTPQRAWTSERIMRSKILSTVIPSYPTDAVQSRRNGVCVVYVSLDANGGVSSVQIVESPTMSIFNSVEQAVTRWRFKPFKAKDGEPILMSSKLTFYFEIKNGKGFVFDPNDAGYVGPCSPDK
jgi:TonB family protein